MHTDRRSGGLFQNDRSSHRMDFRFRGTWLLLLLLVVGWAGCQRPAPPAEEQLTVEIPDSDAASTLESPPVPATTIDPVTMPPSAAEMVEKGDPTPSATAPVPPVPVAPVPVATEPAPTLDPVVAEAPLTAEREESVKAEGDAEPEAYTAWPAPQVTLVVTGNQYGYIEPCGCTGLENQKGGLARRMTFLDQLRASGWQVVPIDAGNQVRRFGRQAEIKFQNTATGLQQMGYQAVGFGPRDLKLGVGELVAVAAADDPQQGLFVSSNVTLIDPALTARLKVIESGGRRIGVTSVLDPAALESPAEGEIEVTPVDVAMAQALADMNAAEADFRVVMYYGEEAAAIEAVRKVPGYDLLIISGGFGEPTYRPQTIEGSTTRWIVTGNKGMYAGLVALYPDQPFRYARVAMTHDFADAPAMRQLMANYQNQLQAIGLSGLGLRPIAHPSGDQFVGSKVCGECHTTAYAIWEGSAHFRATTDIVEPGERADVARHFDPECISCHVTGWNPQGYYPYESGYLSLAESSHLSGNGCENCHGPGAKHAAAEGPDSGVAAAERDLLRLAMRLPLDKAKDRCLECHDIDNSPDFHKEGAFDDYWAEVEHQGLD